MAGEIASGGSGSGSGDASGVRAVRLDLVETSLAWANRARVVARTAKAKIKC